VGKLERRYFTDRSLLGIRKSLRNFSSIPMVGAVSIVMSISVKISNGKSFIASRKPDSLCPPLRGLLEPVL
jgi:hypothetical protein